MMFPGTPVRGTRSPVRAFVTEFLTILKCNDFPSAKSLTYRNKAVQMSYNIGI